MMAKFIVQIFVAAATSLVVGSLGGASAIETVDSLDVTKYLGRWYQAYGNAFTARTIIRDSTCVAADYGLDEATGNITVINSDREHIPTGDLNTITGYAYGTDESEPGQLKVHLGQVPVDGDYWIVGLGPATFGPNEAYEWAIVSGPEAETLFILVRDVEYFEEIFADSVLAFVKDLGFTGPMKEPQRIIQEGCLPFDPTTLEQKTPSWEDILAAMKRDEDGSAVFSGDESVDGIVDEMAQFVGDWTSWKPVVPVTALDITRYTGRWYQAYSSYTVEKLFEQNGACVTADYEAQDDGSVSVINSARAKSVDGELIQMDGYAYAGDDSEPGKLKVHLDGVPVDSPYWVLALGDEDGTGPYPWAIVSDPIRAFLFLLVRDPETFFGSQAETDILAKCEELGFTAFWNSPRATEHQGCEYTAPVPPAVEDKAVKLSPALLLRGGGIGVGGPLHASCKVTFNFAKIACEEVSGALVTAAENMSGFSSCNGGNKCGYTVSKVADGKLEFVHETSVKHYTDSMTYTLSNKGGSCEAKGSSRSDTWYAVLDNSVNYCNLHNLVDATGLKYEEADVSDSTCTQYSSADCDRY